MRDSFEVRIRVAVAALGVGILLISTIVWWSRSETQGARVAGAGAEPPVGDSAEAASSTLPSEIEALWAELEAEQNARAALEEEVERLRAALERLTPAREGGTAPTADGEAHAEERPAPSDAADASPRPGFDDRALVDLGLSEDDATRLRDRFEAYELDSLYLRDQARREHWFGQPRYAVSQRDLRDRLREEVGDEEYDLMLYASGRSNRVKISQVLVNSPAARAGLLPGDVVLSYDEHRVFRVADLVNGTTRARAGVPVAVDVLREGEELRFYVPGGPLGVRPTHLRQPPDVQW